MKSYLDLIPISAKVHKKQSRMTRFCIVLAVSLVTVIFGMADMEIRSQKLQSLKKNGNWHMMLKNVEEEEARMIMGRPEVAAASRYDALNYRLTDDYYLNAQRSVICGADPEFFTKIADASSPLAEGNYPSGQDEVMLTKTAKTVLGVEVGDRVDLDTPSGIRLHYKVSGFAEDTSMMLNEDAVGVMTNVSVFEEIRQASDAAVQGDYDGVYYIQLKPGVTMKQTINEIKEQYHLSDENVSLNTELLGLMGQSDDSYMKALYMTAAGLFLIVLLAGVLMIASSLNSNVAQRTEFFGMMRCLGASKKQVIRFVRLEALQWCKTAVPAGLLIGISIVWGLCAMLRYLSPGLFAEMPVFGISWISVACGALAGGLTVFFASQSPAKRASKVSPLAAVSGNASLTHARKAADTKFFRIPVVLGISHVKQSKKNYFLMTGSFALSVILFLSFSTTIHFMNHAIRPLAPYAPDISVSSEERRRSIGADLIDRLQKNPAVDRVYGRMFEYGLSVSSREENFQADLVSFEKEQMHWAEDLILEGSAEALRQNEDAVLIDYDPESSVKAGDTVSAVIGGVNRELKVAGIMSTEMFGKSEDRRMMACSEKVFQKFAGPGGYTSIDIQLKKQASDSQVDQIRKESGSGVLFSDRRSGNAEVQGAYLSFALFLYGFLVVIVLITVFNIVNSVAMSVAARMNQYGAMRAIGMSDSQMVKMILAEAVTYAVSGSIVGCLVGLPVHKIMFQAMVTNRWGDPWSFPWIELILIVGLVITASAAAVWGPAGRIRKMSIVDTIRAE